MESEFLSTEELRKRAEGCPLDDDTMGWKKRAQTYFDSIEDGDITTQGDMESMFRSAEIRGARAALEAVKEHLDIALTAHELGEQYSSVSDTHTAAKVTVKMLKARVEALDPAEVCERKETTDAE